MFDLPSSSYRSLLIAAIILAIIGWLGLFLLLVGTLPTVGPRWLFFFLLALAITGTTLPFIWLLHRRFAEQPDLPAVILLRRALLVTLYSELCIWLQINRSLTLSLSILLGLGLVAIEWFLRRLDRSSWRPNR
ncbi:MAG: hypothetical protein KAI06_00350 [Anaerolineales bacterium]|nr:hypothetical protein [Anaerolineales bacterium]